MATIVAQELKKWKEFFSEKELDEYDITIANIILENYEELIESGGTAVGKRIKKMAELVLKRSLACDAELKEVLVNSSQQTNSIKRIKSLEVESFRGFATSRKFVLGKQYVLLYGPNGSGKTSFSEALECALLGSIEEADADHIKLATYIKNTSTKKGIIPVVRCQFEDGSENAAEENYDKYRFAFVEKNRITDFSHISGLNAKSQSERMAALFGLTEFTNFVKGFPKLFDEKYLSTSSQTEQAFMTQLAVKKSKQTELEISEKELNVLKDAAKILVDSLSKENKEITTLQQALNYYDNAETGILTLKIQNKDKLTSKGIDSGKFCDIKRCCKDAKQRLEDIASKRGELANKALEVNYKQLFESISKIEETEVCPACGTPIIQAKHNPFLYAKEKLAEFKEIDKIKKEIRDKAIECKNSIDELDALLNENKELTRLLEIGTPNLQKMATSDIEKCEETVKEWQELIRKILIQSENEVNEKIDSYNNEVSKKNATYLKEIEDLREKEKKLVALSTKLSEKEKVVNESKAFIDNFDKNSEATLLIIKKEKEQASYNAKMIESYKKVVADLYEYADKLPELIAQDLEEKIVDYYNTINQGDAEFEMLSNISLPYGESSQLMITFKDGSTTDALQVLSEGHIKILGLSILLAKAIKDHLNFIIFDDIVNAIDDEHRNGVANLLIKHNDFKDIQIILSTHGDQFIMKLKDRLGPSRCGKDSLIYKFLPADSLQERGVLVEYSDAKTPMEAAKKKYDSNELKDAASKCRQAMECVSYNLWGKITKTSKGELSVALRSPKAQPDLRSIVDALKEKCNKIPGMESITEKLGKITEQDNWRVLNKGTHFEDEQPEFDREDVKSVIDILTELDDEVRRLSIQESVVV